MSSSFPTQFQNPLPTAHDGLHTRVAKIELRLGPLEAPVLSFNGRTGAVTLLAADVSAVSDARYVLKSGDTMTGNLVVGAEAASFSTVRLTVQDSLATTIAFVNNVKTPNGAAGSGGIASLILRSTTLASYGWRVSADGATDTLIISDEGVGGVAWFPAGANPAFGIGSVSGAGVLETVTASGRLLLANSLGTDFDRLQLGGTTSAFPALKRNGTGIDVRLADDSAAAPLTSGALTIALASALVIPSGANTRAGNATLVGGTVTVANTTVTANSIVMLTRKTSGGTLGTNIQYTLSAGASFTITSDSVLDTSTFSYFIIERP